MQVSIPQKFFLSESKKEYSSALFERLVAEVIQNSRDAGATEIDLTFNDKGYTIRDNGKGMDKQTLLLGMMTLGGSIKEEGNTGAFGAAKKLVLFSHESYTVRTQNLLARGRVLDYELEEDRAFYKGTEISATFYPEFDVSSLDYYARNVLKKCDFSNSCRVIINGEEFTDWMSWEGCDVIETDWCTIKTRVGSGYVNVRKNGIFAFNRWTSSNKKQCIIELKPPSLECFTQNRDGLRPPYSTKLDAICAEMSQDESTFGMEGIREYLYVGRSRFLEFVSKIKESSEEASKVVASLGDILVYQTTEQKKMVLDALSAFTVSKIDQKQLKEVNEEMCDQIEYDFVIDLADSDYQRPPDKYSPKTMPKKYRFLAVLWKTTILEILKLAGKSLEFKIGFTFDKNAKALYNKREDQPAKLLINPEVFDFALDYEKRFWALFVSALEETCHAIAHNESYCTNHNETYNSHKNDLLTKILPQLSWRTVWKQAQVATL